MQSRLRFFALHLLGSASVLTLVLGGLYLGWYRWPGWYLSSALHIVGIVVLVDLVVGPTLTLIVANPRKPRRMLARDIAMIVTVQIVALIYGAATLWGGRPLYYTFSSDRLEFVQASDLQSDEIAVARRENPSLAPHWYSLPRWVWAPLPDDSDKAMQIVQGSVFGSGKDVIDMPRYFKPWEAGVPKLSAQLMRLDDIRYFSKKEKQSLRTLLEQQGLAPDKRNALTMWGAGRRVLAVFDPDTLQIQAIFKP
jgi:hypothetical protein